MSEKIINKNHNKKNNELNSSAEKDLIFELFKSNFCNALITGYLLIETDEKYGTDYFKTAMVSVKKRIQNENFFRPQ